MDACCIGYVAGISPLLQGRNGYLPSIGWKGRVIDGNGRKMKQKWSKENRKERNGNPAHKVRLQKLAYNLLEHKMNLQSN